MTAFKTQTGALGQGADSDQHQGAAHDVQVGCSAKDQSRSGLPSDGQSELPTDWFIMTAFLMPPMIVRFYQGWFQ